MEPPAAAAAAASTTMASALVAAASSSADAAPATTRAAPLIQPIDQSSIHRICSGQVILDLSTAVKELLENSLDAGATHVTVSFSGWGAQAIEVADNGGGVRPDCYAGLALKHWTSKLRSFTDLAAVRSFGFRGEALSSLCALADLSVLTRCEGENIATALRYNHEGVLVEQKPASRMSGTTTILSNLFSTLPVRHKVFLKNLKKEYGKMLNVIQSYAMLCKGVRIHVYNTPQKEAGGGGGGGGNNARTLVLSTQGSQDVRELITNVFGAKQAACLQEVDAPLISNEQFNLRTYAATQHAAADAAAAAASSTSLPNSASDAAIAASSFPATAAASSSSSAASVTSSPFRLCGYISRMDSKCGRSASDRQYLYVNGRPVDLPRVAKVINEAYRACSGSSTASQTSWPVFVLNLLLPAGSFDVNLTPNKRETMLHDEAALLGLIKTHFQKLFEPSMYTYRVKELGEFGIKTASNTRTNTSSSQPAAEDLTDGNDAKKDKMTMMDNLEDDSLVILSPPPQPVIDPATRAMSLFLSPDQLQQQQQQQQSQQLKREPSPAPSSARKSPSVTTAEPKEAPSTPRRHPPHWQDAPTAPSTNSPPSAASSPALAPFSVQSLPNNKRTSTSFLPPGSAPHSSSTHATTSGLPPPGSRTPRPITHILQAMPPPARAPAAYAAALKPLSAPLVRHQSTPVVATSASSAAAVPPSPASASVSSTRSTNSFLRFMRRDSGSAVPSAAVKQESSLPPPSSPLSATQSLTISPVADEDNDAEVTPTDNRASKRPRVEATSAASAASLVSTSRGLSRQATMLLPRTASPAAAAAALSPDIASSSPSPSPSPDSDPSLALFDDTDIGVEYRASTSRRRVDLDMDALERFYLGDDQNAAAVAEDASSIASSSLLHRAEAVLSPSSVAAASVSAAELLGGSSSSSSSSPTPAVASSAPAARVLSEDTMKRVIEKADFLEMEIVGQFNLGFIIAKRNHDLFIIDQHATDEKYRFELLQRTTTLNSQPLLNPLPLDCTPSMEIVIKEHLHIFRQNGFQIDLDSEESAGAAASSSDAFCDDSQASPMDTASRRCIRVKTLPFTKNITFGAADIYELCALLNENPGVMVRLPKVTSMFASRACRSAVMIGTALNKAKMSSIVKHMAEMEHPWACPHGRPTMRHLFDLSQLHALQEGGVLPARPEPSFSSPVPRAATRSPSIPCCSHDH